MKFKIIYKHSAESETSWMNFLDKSADVNCCCLVGANGSHIAETWISSMNFSNGINACKLHDECIIEIIFIQKNWY